MGFRDAFDDVVVGVTDFVQDAADVFYYNVGMKLKRDGKSFEVFERAPWQVRALRIARNGYDGFPMGHFQVSIPSNGVTPTETVLERNLKRQIEESAREKRLAVDEAERRGGRQQLMILSAWIEGKGMGGHHPIAVECRRIIRALDAETRASLL